MKLKVLELSEADRGKLVEVVAKGCDWRMRHRAQTLLHFGDGLRAKAIAMQQGLHLDTVYDRRKHWLTDGFQSLADQPRCGTPVKLTEVHREKLRTWASEEALTARDLLAKLKAEFEVSVHLNTLKNALKEMKLVWKRTRHSLKKTRRAEISGIRNRNQWAIGVSGAGRDRTRLRGRSGFWASPAQS